MRPLLAVSLLALLFGSIGYADTTNAAPPKSTLDRLVDIRANHRAGMNDFHAFLSQKGNESLKKSFVQHAREHGVVSAKRYRAGAWAAAGTMALLTPVHPLFGVGAAGASLMAADIGTDVRQSERKAVAATVSDALKQGVHVEPARLELWPHPRVDETKNR